MKKLKLYEGAQQITEMLASNQEFKDFCTATIGKEIENIDEDEDFTMVELEDYPRVIVNANKQSGTDDIDRAIEFVVLIEATGQKQKINGVNRFVEIEQCEEISAKIYDLVRRHFCYDTPPYYYQKDTSMIYQKIMKGSFEIVTTIPTSLGEEQW